MFLLKVFPETEIVVGREVWMWGLGRVTDCVFESIKKNDTRLLLRTQLFILSHVSHINKLKFVWRFLH